MVLPNMPSAEATGSERKVLSLLRSVDWGGVTARALNSLNLAEHAYQRWGEIDFLLVGPKGLIAIEVKGGDVTCVTGTWHYTDRMGRVVSRGKSPVVQAKDAYFSLVKHYVAPHLGQGFSTRVPTGFCVIFAGMPRARLEGLLGTPEFPEALVGSQEDLASSNRLQSFLERVSRYWQDKSNSAKRIEEHDVIALVKHLRPEFEQVRPLVLARERFGEEMLTLTGEQYAVLDHWEGADRIFCSSPAGCGKTLIAVEMLRRANAEAMTALLLVGTRTLASALRERMGLHDQVLSIDELEEMDPALWPKPMILLIDEGQQMLSPRRLKILDELIPGGVAAGKWAWFGDPEYQATSCRGEGAAGLESLMQAASVRPRLTRNCRNTPEIITAAELASGVALGHATVSGRGFHPSMLAASDANEAAGAIVRQVKGWLDQDISLGSITLLTNDANADSLAASVARLGDFPVTTWATNKQRDESLAYSSVESFRGLESEFVVLCLVGPCPTDDELSRMLYLGMTRGNFALAVVASPSILKRVQERMADSAKKHLEDVLHGC